MPLHPPPATGPKTVQVMKSEEKGSDVNLATYLLVDAFDDEYETAVVVTNDSDLAEPIRLVRQKFKKKVLVLHPCRPGRKPSFELRKVATKSLIVDTSLLPGCHYRRRSLMPTERSINRRRGNAIGRVGVRRARKRQGSGP